MRRRVVVLVLALAVAAIDAYACWRERRICDEPAAMARLETAMWRDYYDKYYPTLFCHAWIRRRARRGDG